MNNYQTNVWLSEGQELSRSFKRIENCSNATNSSQRNQLIWPRFFVVFAVVCQRLNWIASESREFSLLLIPLVLLLRTLLYSFGSKHTAAFSCLALDVSES